MPYSFYINLPIGGFAAAIICLTFRTPATQKANSDKHVPLKEKFLQMDFPGLVVAIGAMECLLLALYWGGVSKPWNDNTVIGTLLGFGLLSIAFIAIEYRQGKYAMLVHSLIEKREVWVGSAVSFFLAGKWS